MKKIITVEYKKCQLETPIPVNEGMSITDGMCMEATDGSLYLYSEIPFSKDDFDKTGELIYSAPHYGELKKEILSQIKEFGYPEEWFVFKDPTDYLENSKTKYLKRIEIYKANGVTKSKGYDIWKQKLDEIIKEIDNHKDQGWSKDEIRKQKENYLKMLDDEMEIIDTEE